MAYNVERPAGAWVTEQAARRERNVLALIIVFLLAGAAMLALAADQRVGVAASLAFVALALVGRRFARHYIDESSSWLRGAHAERAVGDTLNALRREGWILLHDAEQPGEGNIDHIASGPNGIFLVETKLRRYEVDQLTKVKRQAAKLHRQLGVWVTPVICLHHRTGKPFRVQGVWVVPHRELLPWLRTRNYQPVPFDRLARFADTL